MMYSVEIIEILLLYKLGHYRVSERNHEHDNKRKEHLDNVVGCKTKQTHHKQLEQLQEGKLVHRSLWAASDIMVWRILGLSDRYQQVSSVGKRN